VGTSLSELADAVNFIVSH